MKSSSAFRTISEVAGELDLPQHVLRFWETKFSQVRPLKRGGGRRYYRPEDVALLQRIRDLLYTEGYTIKGVQKLLREGHGKLRPSPAPAGERVTSIAGRAWPIPGRGNGGQGDEKRETLRGILRELEDLRDLLRRAQR